MGCSSRKDKTYSVLIGSRSSFIATRDQLLLMNPWSNVNQVFMLIKQERKQRQMHDSGASPITMMVNLPKYQ